MTMPTASSGAGRYTDHVEQQVPTSTVCAAPSPIRGPESRRQTLVSTPAGGLSSCGVPSRPQPVPLVSEGGGYGKDGAELRRTGTRQLATIRDQLSARDWSILRSLRQHRFLTTTHLYRLHFWQHMSAATGERVCRKVLKRLADYRVIEHLDRRIGGTRAGSKSYIWRVGVLGDRLLQEASGNGSRDRRKEPSERWLEHCLAVADVHLQLVGAARNQQLELVTLQTEPWCWRDYLGSSGRKLVLKPDLYLLTVATPTGTPSAFEDHWYVEVDRATESLPTVITQCQQYEAYRRSGNAHAEHGVFPLVLWVVPHEARARKLRHAIQTTGSLDTSLFRVTTPEQFLMTVLGETV